MRSHSEFSLRSGIEKIDGDSVGGRAGDRITPRANLHGSSGQLERHDGFDALEHVFRLPCLGSFRLVSCRIERLAKIAFPMQESYCGDGNTEVGSGPQRVTCQHAESA